MLSMLNAYVEINFFFVENLVCISRHPRMRYTIQFCDQRTLPFKDNCMHKAYSVFQIFLFWGFLFWMSVTAIQSSLSNVTPPLKE